MQTTETIRGLYNINFAIPGMFMLIALLIWSLGYPLTKEVTAQMLAELTEQRKLAGALKPAADAA